MKTEIKSWFEIRQGGTYGPLWSVSAPTVAEAKALAQVEFERFERAGVVQLPCLLSLHEVFDDRPITEAAAEIVADAARASGRTSSAFRDRQWRQNWRRRMFKHFNFEVMGFASPVRSIGSSARV